MKSSSDISAVIVATLAADRRLSSIPSRLKQSGTGGTRRRPWAAANNTAGATSISGGQWRSRAVSPHRTAITTLATTSHRPMCSLASSSSREIYRITDAGPAHRPSLLSLLRLHAPCYSLNYCLLSPGFNLAKQNFVRALCKNSVIIKAFGKLIFVSTGGSA